MYYDICIRNDFDSFEVICIVFRDHSTEVVKREVVKLKDK